jgi:hypothetical protein
MSAATTLELAALIGGSVDSGQAESVLAIITAQARSYCRDVGFTDGVPSDEIKFGAILPAAARLLAHTRQIPMSTTLGPQSVDFRAGFQGFSISEKAVLDRFRVRAL